MMTMATVGSIRCCFGFAFCWMLLTGLATDSLGQAAPINDSFANRIVLSGSTNYVIASNVGASREAGEPSHAGSEGGSSIWWSWTAERSGTVLFSTTGSSFDTLLAIYFGDSLTNLTQIVSDDDDDLGNMT